MIFLIEYNRTQGTLVTFRHFDDSQRQDAADSRLQLELELNRREIDHEVVLLETDNEATLRQTHSRYFKTLRQLLKAAIDA